MEFFEFKKEMQTHVAKILKDQDTLFITDIDNNELWEKYLDSFPEGTNEIYRERREYDCSCCKHFIRSFGNVVVVKNNTINTIWDFKVNDNKYQTVINVLSKFVKKVPIQDVFVTKQASFGTDKNHEKLDDGSVYTWNHFYITLPKRFITSSPKSEASLTGEFRDIKNVFQRSLNEISQDAIDTILDLIAQKSLYKGDEWKSVLTQFFKIHKEYHKLTDKKKDLYCWTKSIEVGGVIGKIKNHSIGVLLADITDGMELNKAVKRYEAIVAPTNYKRPKAIFTKKMIEEAQQTITELCLLDSLGRRHATIDDITINNILFANRDAVRAIKGDVFSDLQQEVATSPKKFDKVEEVPIENFVKDILPNATNIEVLFENKHSPNLMSLIAPKVEDSKTLFKWDNGFSWAYNGNITDSELTERVRAAGGRIDGVLRFSHSWNHKGMRNGSLMDLHVFMPGSNQKITMRNGKEIHDNYGNDQRVGWNHRKHYKSGGIQDVDYVNIAPINYIPVENTTFPSLEKLVDGVYTFKIHNWDLRRPTHGGFKAEIAVGGEVYKFERKEPLKHKEWVTLAKIKLENREWKILEMSDNNTSPINIWNIQTNQFHPVSLCMFSPNYWDEQKGIGNKHYFFILKDCINEDQPNGFFNEFLKQDLEKHKRVFEALGSKMKVEQSDEQLSGLGFSSTKRNSLVCKVEGHFTRMIKVIF